MNRLNQILIGLLALQVVVAAVVLWPRPSTTGEGESLFPDVEADRIVALSITAGDGQSLQLARQDGQWVLPKAGDYPVQEDKVPPVLEKISSLQAERLVTETSGSHKRLQVAEDSYERLIEFELDDGTRHQLYLGTSPSFGVAHVRAAGQDEVYLTSELSAQDIGAAAADWVERTYLEIPRDEIVAVSLENNQGRLEFRKDGETWTMAGLEEGETLDEAGINTLVSRVATVTLLEPLGKEEQTSYGLQQPSAVVTVETQSETGGNRTYTLRVGAQDPADNSYVLISSESPYYVRVTEFAVRDLVEQDRDDFLVPPPTPTSEVTPEAIP